MREEIPAGSEYPEARRALMAELAGRSRPRSRRGMVVGMVAAAAAVAVAAGLIVAGTGSGPARPTAGRSAGTPATAQLVAVTSPMTLAANATVIASQAPVPAPNKWIYVKMMTTLAAGPPAGTVRQRPGTRTTNEHWTRVDGTKSAAMEHGRIVATDEMLGSPVGWPQITYTYLNSLPTTASGMLARIKRNIRTIPTPEPGATEPHIFDAILALVENYQVLPPKVSAALYGAIALLKSVHLEHTADLAGKKVLGLYQVQDGWLKQEILVDPSSYAYAGQIRSAVADHSSTALDGTTTVTKGELLDDEAVVATAIVAAPGDR
jgi:hypothetical protein